MQHCYARQWLQPHPVMKLARSRTLISTFPPTWGKVPTALRSSARVGGRGGSSTFALIGSGAQYMPTKTIANGTVADAYLQLLADRGIDYLFANAGTDFAPLIEAYAKAQAHGVTVPKPITVPHENVAINMAQGYYLRPAARRR